jgi:hypothetical protein
MCISRNVEPFRVKSHGTLVYSKYFTLKGSFIIHGFLRLLFPPARWVCWESIPCCIMKWAREMPSTWGWKCDHQNSDRNLKFTLCSGYREKRDNLEHMSHAMHNSSYISATRAKSFGREHFYFQRDTSFLKQKSVGNIVWDKYEVKDWRFCGSP